MNKSSLSFFLVAICSGFWISSPTVAAQDTVSQPLAWDVGKKMKDVVLSDFSSVEDYGESQWFLRATASFQMLVAEPVAIMVLAANPEEAERIAGDEIWKDFCRRAGWCFVTVGVEAKPEIEREEEGDAQEWIDSQIFSWLDGDKIALKNQRGELPVFTMLLDGASDWLLPGMLNRSARVRAWTARGLLRFPETHLPADVAQTAENSDPLSPGLLVSSYSGRNRLQWEFMKSLRLGDPRNRVAFFPHQKGRMNISYQEDFGRRFLRSVALNNMESGRWVRYLDSAPLTMEDVKTADLKRLAEFIWFPSEEISGAWKTLCPSRPSEPDYVVKMHSRIFRKPPPFFQKVGIHHSKPPIKPKAVLVLAMDTDRPQSIFQSQAWIDYVREQEWALVVVDLHNSRRIRSHNNATEWLEARLFEFIDKGPYKNLKGIPVICYTSGRPAYWMQRLIVRQPKRFLSWCVEGAPEFAVIPQRVTMPSGLIIAQREDVHFRNLFFLQDVRKANKANRVCMLAGDREKLDPSYIEDFARQFLAEAANRKNGNGFWLRYKDGKRLTFAASQLGVDPSDYVWFPNNEVAGTWNLISNIRPQIPFPVIEKTVVKTRVKEQPELNLFVRIPGIAAKDNSQPVKGVLCFSNWQKEDTSIVNRLKKPDDPMVAFADRNNLAIITWNTAAMLPKEKWVQDLNEKEEKELLAKFDQIGKSWLKGVDKICRQFKLPDKGFLLHGISRGSTYAHRLALRYPERFLAVHTHIANHYEMPNENAASVLWLVTTGELDGGYLETRKFYNRAQKLNYPILIKAGPSLGHEMREDIEMLSYEFFDRALYYNMTAKNIELKSKQGSESKRSKATVAELFREDMKAASYFGDFINNEIYRIAEGDWIPESQRILLPTEKLANAWGESPNGGEN